jgi:hypothetical protein
MPSLNVLIQTGEVCRCLREKKMFYETPGATISGGMEIVTASTGPDGPFWCAQTQSLLGPDGQVADAESCRPGRSCCEIA